MVVNYLRENGLHILLILFTFLFLMSIFSILGINTKNNDKNNDNDKKNDNDKQLDEDGKKYKKIVTVEGFKSDIDYKYYINKNI